MIGIKAVKWSISLVLIVGVIVIIGLFVPSETHPSGDTRIILDHTYQTYTAPACFEESGLTNFLEEATLEKAKELDYPAHSVCTEEALASEKDSLLGSWLKNIGIVSKKWDNW